MFESVSPADGVTRPAERNETGDARYARTYARVGTRRSSSTPTDPMRGSVGDIYRPRVSALGASYAELTGKPVTERMHRLLARIVDRHGDRAAEVLSEAYAESGTADLLRRVLERPSGGADADLGDASGQPDGDRVVMAGLTERQLRLLIRNLINGVPHAPRPGMWWDGEAWQPHDPTRPHIEPNGTELWALRSDTP